MAEEQVKEWIEKKLDRGVSEERIKKTLEKTGRDPGLVDEVNSPFDGEEGESQEGEDLEKELSKSEEDKTESPSSSDESEEGSGLDSLRFVDDDEEKDTRKEDDTGQEEESSESSLSLPSVPSPSMPSVSAPSVNISSKKLLPLVALLFVAGAGYAGMNFMNTDTVASSVSDSLNTCNEGVGVKMYAVGENNGNTVADVYTGGKAETVLEIYSDDRKMGEKTKTLDGRGMIRVSAVGDRAVFHEEGCEEPFVERNY